MKSLCILKEGYYQVAENTSHQNDQWSSVVPLVRVAYQMKVCKNLVCRLDVYEPTCTTNGKAKTGLNMEMGIQIMAHFCTSEGTASLHMIASTDVPGTVIQ